MKHFLVLVCLFKIIQATPQTRPTFNVGVPIIGGSGCPSNSASIALLQDPLTNDVSVTVLFDNYRAETSRTIARDRKSCNVVVPLLVPSGFSTTLMALDWRGNADIGPNAAGQMTASYFWAGSQGPSLSKSFGPNTHGNFLWNNDVGSASVVRTPCGRQILLRANTNIEVAKVPRSLPEASIVVDSLDISAKNSLIFQLNWQPCV